MDEILTMMRERLAAAENEVVRLRAGIAELEARPASSAAAEATPRRSTPRRPAARRTATRTAVSRSGRAAASALKPATPRTPRALTTGPSATSGTAPAEETRPVQVTKPAPQARTPERQPRAADGDTAPRSRQRGAAVTPERVLALVTADGVARAELCTQTGASESAMLSALKRLESDGQVRRSGERRSQRWHLVTDEDRIAARAAELEQAQTSRAVAAG